MDVTFIPIVVPARPKVYALKDGQVFIAQRLGKIAYMRIDPIENADGEVKNAVELGTGRLCFFRPDEEVSLPKQAQLRIEE